jgi:hypothetical protein
MDLGTILLVLIIVALVGAFPSWRHSRNWGYGPSSALGVALLVVIALLVFGAL